MILLGGNIMKRRSGLKIAFAIMLLISVVDNFGCRNDLRLPPVDKSLASDDGDFTLYVSGTSTVINRVDIQIMIDGKVAVARYFDVRPRMHSRPKRFVLSLPEGDHTIEMRSDQESVHLKESFTVSDRHWARVSFWRFPEDNYGQHPAPKGFSFQIQDEPVIFQ
jgi:hypothetical protein